MGMFSPLNTIILIIYMAAMLGIGLWFSRRQTSTNEYFLAGRRMPWLVVAMSMYASLTSAVTFLALPAMAYTDNISMVVVCVVSPIVAPILVRVFYPFYHRLGLTTSYEYIGRRFGRPAQLAVSCLFILARLGWLGTVIFAPALSLSVVSDFTLTQSILLMGIVATLYTALGGIAADIWTDVVQFVIMIAGVVWVAITLSMDAPGGVAEILSTASAAGHLHVASWKFGIHEMTGLVVAVTFFFQLMQEYGTDQCTVQRMMTTPSLAGVKKAIYFNACVDFLVIGMLLFVGLGLFAYGKNHPSVFSADLKPDALLPFYIIHALPDGVSGLLVTAILAAAMSSMDSGISSLSTVIVKDWIEPAQKMNEASRLRLAKILVFVFGVLATAVAFKIASFESLVKGYTSFISLFSAPVLALFLLGILTRRASAWGWLIGCAVSIPSTLYLQNVVKAHWVYYFPFSFLVALTLGYLASFLFAKPSVPDGLTLWEKR